jgi:hypothetical protein
MDRHMRPTDEQPRCEFDSLGSILIEISDTDPGVIVYLPESLDDSDGGAGVPALIRDPRKPRPGHGAASLPIPKSDSGS